MSILMVSDIHLDESRPEIAELFLRFLKNDAPASRALYILGDFFEAWIGDDNLTDFNLSIIHALREATEKGLPIYIMHGNRDFLLGKRFFKATGCTLLPDEVKMDLFGVPTLLMHGDSLCTRDTTYMKFRKKSRSWLIQKLFLLQPLRLRQQKAAQYRDASKAHVSTLAEDLMDVTPSEVERVMRKHQVLSLIHGHTHREGAHRFTLDENPAKRTVLGAWHDHGSVLVCEPNKDAYFVSIR